MGNCLHLATNRLMPALDFAEAVTLVVGNDTKCKARVAEALAEARGATIYEDTKAGVRVFSRKSALSVPVVINTVPLSTSEDWKPVESARAWISQNGLRKLGGKLVFVVCVIASTDPEDEIYQKPDFGGNRFSWLHLLACVFEEHIQKIMILVHSEDKSVEISEDSSTNVSSRGLPHLSEALKRHGFTGRDNTIFFNYRGERVPPTMKLVLQYSVYRDDDEEDDDDQPRAGAGAFLLPSVLKTAAKKDRFGPWGPENVILFGRSGSGKSTLAQMLTLGRLDSRRGRALTVSASLRGETKKVSTAFGRGWCVIDTPGLGEPVDDDKSSIATAKARELIKTHVQLVEGTYSHFFYVWKKARVEDLDELLWKEFKHAFEAEGIKTPMTVVVSDAHQEWLEREENISRLKQCFEGCDSFVTAYFPLPEIEDGYDTDRESTDLRLESLKELEDEISSLGRKDTSTKVGKWSRGTELREWKRREYDYTTLRPSIRQNPAFGPSAADPQPSDYDAARLYIRMQSWKAKIAAAALKIRNAI